MINEENFEDSKEEKSQLEFELELNAEAKKFLLSAAKWANIISILSFVFIAFLLFFTLSTSAIFSEQMDTEGRGFSSWGITSFYLFSGFLYFLPTYFLFRFSMKTKLALQSKDDMLFAGGMKALKTSFMIIAILMILLGILYAMVFLFIIQNDISQLMN